MFASLDRVKKNHACPKCNGRKIWILEPLRLPDETRAGRVLPLVPHQTDEPGGFFQVVRLAPKGEIDLYVCDGCGFSEMWARGVRELVEDPGQGVRLLDSSATKAGPFR